VRSWEVYLGKDEVRDMKGTIEEIISQDDKFYARYLIGKARHALLKIRRKELAPSHISPRQAQIIFILSNLQRANLAELAKHSNRGINTLSNQMRLLEKDGLVKKFRETPKSTLLTFELTQKGSDICDFSFKGNRIERQVMAALSDDELKQIISMLEKLINEAETQGR